MELSNQALALVIGALASNTLLTLIPGALTHPVAFWGVELVQLAFAAFMFGRGLPGMDGMPAASWMLGALFLYHAAQNFQRRTRLLGMVDTGDVEDEADEENVP